MNSAAQISCRRKQQLPPVLLRTKCRKCAQLRTAREQQAHTALFADAPGAVTAVGAEPGEVVHAGQTVVQLARQGGRDAVFDVPEQLIQSGPRDPEVEIALSSDPQVKATGRVREISP